MPNPHFHVLVDIDEAADLSKRLQAELEPCQEIACRHLTDRCLMSALPDLVVTSSDKRGEKWRSLGIDALVVEPYGDPLDLARQVRQRCHTFQVVSPCVLMPDVAALETLSDCETAVETLLRALVPDCRLRWAAIIIFLQVPHDDMAQCRSYISCVPDLAAPEVVTRQHLMPVDPDEMQAITSTIQTPEFLPDGRDALLALLPAVLADEYGQDLRVVASQASGLVRGLVLLGTTSDLTAEMTQMLELVLLAIMSRWGVLLSQDAIWRHSLIMDHAKERTELGQWMWNQETDEFTIFAGLSLALGGDDRQSTIHLQEWSRRVHPGDLKDWNEMVGAAQAPERPSAKAKLRLLGFDDQWHTVHLQAKLPMDEYGQPGMIMNGILVDTTRYHDVELLGNKLITAVEQSGEAIMITDAENRIEYVNPAFSEMSGYGREECIGQPAGMLSSGMHEAAFFQQMWNTLNRGQTWSGRLTNQRKDGTLYEEESTISPIHDEYGQVIGYVAVKRDVSEELEHERQLQQAQRMESVGRVAGGLVHDFNNLLMGIMLFADFALDEVRETSPLHHQIQEIRKAVCNASELIRKLMTISRKQQFEPLPVDMNELLRELRNMIGGLVGEKVVVKMDLDPSMRVIQGDGDQLQQLILNLVVNARDAMDKDGTLTIITSRTFIDGETARRNALASTGWYSMLLVRDTGCGIAPEILDTIFEPFFTTKPKERGTGLGLATVYSVVQQHGGLVKVRSVVDKGTTFRILLPETELRTSEQGAAAGPSQPAGGGKLLVVEDEPLARDMLVEILERMGFQTIAAGDGVEAYKLAEMMEEPVDLLVSDVIMPGPNGPAVYTALKEKWPGLRVLFISGYAYDQFNSPELQGITAQNLLPKPFSTTELAMAIEAAMKG